MQRITQTGAFTQLNATIINQLLAASIGVTSGNVYYLDPVNGNDNFDGTSPSSAVQSLAAGYALLTSGNNDVLVLIGNGTTTGTCRLSSAFTWSKNACHMLGVSPFGYYNRARIAPPSAAATTAFANFFTLSGNACLFSNVELFQGFGTGTTSQIALTVSGVRNVFRGCSIQGMGDAASAQDTGSRSLLITGTESFFDHCQIGLDTVLRTVANYSVELKSNPARTVFEDCVFPQWGSSADAVIVYAGNGPYSFDRWALFKRCTFLAAVKSTSYVAPTGVFTIGTNQSGIMLVQDCTAVGFTGWGHDAGTRAQLYVMGAGPAANATLSETGLAVTSLNA